MQEKKKGEGEDSPALLINKEEFVAVGVFDGMGGAGGKPCKDEEGNTRSMAYVASRIIEKSIENHLENIQSPDLCSPSSLKSIITSRFNQEKEKRQIKNSLLRSDLVRDYPTTMALAIAYSENKSDYTVASFWAGDSRNYLWTKEGLMQISRDDLDGDLDPLENLSNDARMTNCLCANKDFIIHLKKIENIKVPFIIFSATDGCFGYLPTPMHFHKLLQETLQNSLNSEEWGEKLNTEFAKVTGDDISFSLVSIGFENFDTLKKSLTETKINLPETSSSQEKIDSLEKKIHDKQNELRNLSEKLHNIETKKGEYNNTINQNNNKIKQRQQDIVNFEEQCRIFQRNIEESNKVISSLNQENQKLQKEYSNTQKETEDIKARTQKIEEEKNKDVQDLQILKTDRTNEYKKIWEQYKIDYMKYLNDDTTQNKANNIEQTENDQEFTETNEINLDETINDNHPINQDLDSKKKENI